jgi:peptidoglycan/LPS O-acetylase OafA/YrhL
MSALAKIRLGTEKYPALTGVRAVGASVVFFDHFPLWPDAHLTFNVMAFFYALSGFLIVRIYYEQAQLRPAWLGKYFVNRFARIYPVYFLLLTVAVFLNRDFAPWLLIKNYTLVHALFYQTTIIIQPTWSLTVEECFYLLAPVFMLLARRAGFFAPFALGWLLFAAALAVSQLGGSFLGTPGFVMSTTFFGHFVEFFAGVYLALVVMRLEKSGSVAVRGSWRTFAGLAAVLALVIAMLFVYRHPPISNHAIIFINNFLIPGPIALLYWGLLREGTWLARLLSTRTFGLLGRSSYSFYVLHALIIDYFSIPFLLPLSGSRPLYVLLTLLATWLLSVLLFVAYEEPLNLAIRRRFRSKERWVGLQATLFQVPPQA